MKYKRDYNNLFVLYTCHSLMDKQYLLCIYDEVFSNLFQSRFWADILHSYTIVQMYIIHACTEIIIEY